MLNKSNNAWVNELLNNFSESLPWVCNLQSLLYGSSNWITIMGLSFLFYEIDVWRYSNFLEVNIASGATVAWLQYLFLITVICSYLVAQSCPILCCSMDCVPGIFQARIPEWVAISFFRGSSWPRNQTCISGASCLTGGYFTTALHGKSLNAI